MKSDSLFIGFDYTNDDDVTALSVIRMSSSKAEVLNVFTGQEAQEIYEKLTGIKMEEGPGVMFVNRETVLPLLWNHNPNDEIIGKATVKDIGDGVIVDVASYHPDTEFCNNMNKAMDNEIRKEYFSGIRSFDAICEFWDITKEELWRIIANENRN